MYKKVLAVAVAAGLFSGNAMAAPVAQDFELSIAHINDTHSAFDEVRASIMNDEIQGGNPVYTSFGGHPRLMTATNEYRAQAEDADRSMLFLHGGDAWQGSAYFKLYEGKMNADILSRMGLDAMAMGNHEFDLNNEILADFVNNVTFPVLGANMDLSEDEHLSKVDNILPYTLFAFDGFEKEEVTLATMPKDKPVVAVLGMVLEDMPTMSPNVGEVRFSGEVETAQKMVNELKANGVNKIILLTHIGLERDQNIARNVDGIDVIVGGHSHTLLGDHSNLGLGENGTYAEIITTPNGGKTCIVQAGDKAQAIGHANVTFDGATGDMKSCAGNNTLLTADTFYSDSQRESLLTGDNEKAVVSFIDGQDNIAITDEEEQLRAHIDAEYKPGLESAYGSVIAHVPGELEHVRRPNDSGFDKHGSRVAPIMAEGWLHWANSEAVLDASGFEQVDFALIGAGGVRTDIEESSFYEGNVSLDILPFANFLSVLEVEGSAIRNLIDETVSVSLPDSAHMGKFPYAAGLRYVYNETVAQEAGELAVLEVRRMDGEGNVTWETLQDDATYTMTTTYYNANGNDDWNALFVAQSEGVKRFDFVEVDGELVAHAVEKVAEVGSRRSAVYPEGQPDCGSDAVVCNTDATSVINFIAEEMDELVEVKDQPVTLNLLDRE